MSEKPKETKEEFESRVAEVRARWEEKARPILEAIERSRMLTEEDYNLVVNV